MNQLAVLKIIMSVYSGFATRKQESLYNNLAENLIVALKRRIIKVYNEQPCDEQKFKLLIKKIYKKMFLLQRGKFMNPKFSTCFSDLIEILGIQINFDSLSDISSMDYEVQTPNKSRFNNMDHQIFKSRAILQTKRGHLQSSHHLNPVHIPIYSLNKKYNTLGQQNQQDSSSFKQSLQISRALNQKRAKKSENKFKISLVKEKRQQIKEIQAIKGTIAMPKIEDFLPKIQQLEVNRLGQKTTGQKELKQFRRNKYSRNAFQLEEV